MHLLLLSHPPPATPTIQNPLFCTGGLSLSALAPPPAGCLPAQVPGVYNRRLSFPGTTCAPRGGQLPCWSAGSGRGGNGLKILVHGLVRCLGTSRGSVNTEAPRASWLLSPAGPIRLAWSNPCQRLSPPSPLPHPLHLVTLLQPIGSELTGNLLVLSLWCAQLEAGRASCLCRQ